MLSEIFLEFPSRILHAPRGERGFESIKIGPFTVTPAKDPGTPGEVRAEAVTEKIASDLVRIPEPLGMEILKSVKDMSERLGRNYWIYGEFGWLTGGKIEFKIMPDPWHVDERFTENVEDGPRFDPLTDTIMDGIRVKKFHVRYGSGHMTGALLVGDEMTDYKKFSRIVGKMRMQYGKMKHVLYQQRAALFERGRMPSLAYSTLVLNYNEPQMVIIPRAFVPKEAWGAYEMLYNATVVRDLQGSRAEEFWATHVEESRKVMDTIR